MVNLPDEINTNDECFLFELCIVYTLTVTGYSFKIHYISG